MKLKGKVALVTGGGSGIGAAVARAFAAAGAEVAICGRRADALEATRGRIEPVGGRAAVIPADLTRADAIERLINTISGRFGRLDVLVNNAGVLGAHAPIAEYPDQEWDAVIAANLTAVFRLTKAALPLMSRGGSIINVSSGVGRVGRAGWGAYCVSKFGVEGLTQVLAEELREREIRVNAVNPGGTRTAMRAAAYPYEDPATVPTPDDVAPIFVFLASNESDGVTGRSFDARGWRPAPELVPTRGPAA
ncbi:MAG TPA: SDR family NAD(P)-dependent oxidoreductase [Nitrospiria bacterium]|nr:SDR family NAD(P)-dependent oxidoreductase [Nitrospiria bacterium]